MNDKTPLGNAMEKGFIGEVPDKTPNEDYAVGGAVTMGQKVDPAAEKATARRDEAEADLEAMSDKKAKKA